MKSLILIAILGLSLPPPASGMGLVIQEDVSPVDEAQERFKALKKESSAIHKEWVTQLRKQMKEADERGEELPESAFESPLTAFVPRFQAGATDYAGTKSAIPFLLWLAQDGMRIDEEVAKPALVTLIEKHTLSPELKPLAGYGISMIPQQFGEQAGYALLFKLEKESVVPELRGWALYSRHQQTLENAALDSDAYKKAKQEVMDMLALVKDAHLSSEAKSSIIVRENFSIGALVPDIVGVDLDGVEFKLSDYKGKILFVDFWGDW